jgi:hypothetical protein
MPTGASATSASPRARAQDGVRGEQRVAQRGGLRGVELLGLAPRVRVGQVEVARHAQEVRRRHRVAGAVAAVGHVGLHRPQVAPPVEDDGQRLAQREAADAQGDGGRRLGLEERSPQEVVGVAGACTVPVVVHLPSWSLRPSRESCRTEGTPCADSRSEPICPRVYPAAG